MPYGKTPQMQPQLPLNLLQLLGGESKTTYGTDSGSGLPPGYTQDPFTGAIIDPDGNFTNDVKPSGPAFQPDSRSGKLPQSKIDQLLGNVGKGNDGDPFGIPNIMMGGGTPETSTLEDLLAQYAQQVFGPQGGAGDYEQSLQDSAEQIRQAFAAQIGNINASSRTAENTTGKNNKKIDAMYKALRRNYQGSADQEVKSGAAYADKVQDVASRAKGEVTGNAEDLLTEQAALAKGLGVESAAPDLAAAQQKAVGDQVRQIVDLGQRDANQALSYSGTQQRYLDRQGENANLEGTNRQADLIDQLNAFLNDNSAKVADLKGQRGMALASNESNLMKSFLGGQGDQQDRQLDLLKLMATIQDQSGGGGLDDLLSPKQQLENVLRQQMGPGINEGLNTLLFNNGPLSTGKMPTGDGKTTDLTPELAQGELTRSDWFNSLKPEEKALVMTFVAQHYGG